MVSSLTSLADPPNAPEDAVAVVSLLMLAAAWIRIFCAVMVLPVTLAVVLLVIFVVILVRPPAAKPAALCPDALPFTSCSSCATADAAPFAVMVLFAISAVVVISSVISRFCAVPAARSPPAVPLAVPFTVPL